MTRKICTDVKLLRLIALSCCLSGAAWWVYFASDTRGGPADTETPAPVEMERTYSSELGALSAKRPSRSPTKKGSETKAGPSGNSNGFVESGTLFGLVLFDDGSRADIELEQFQVGVLADVPEAHAMLSGAIGGAVRCLSHAMSTTGVNPNGEYRLEGLKPGDYIVVCGTADISLLIWDVTIRAGESATLDLNVGQSCSVEGTVFDNQGAPIPFTRVELARFKRERDASGFLVEHDPTVVASATTDASGCYRCSGIPPGTYLLKVDEECHEANPDYLLERIVDFEVGTTRQKDLIYFPAQEPSVTGRVTLCGEARFNTVIAVRPDHDGILCSGLVAADGSFELCGVPPGSYYLWFVQPESLIKGKLIAAREVVEIGAHGPTSCIRDFLLSRATLSFATESTAAKNDARSSESRTISGVRPQVPATVGTDWYGTHCLQLLRLPQSNGEYLLETAIEGEYLIASSSTETNAPYVQSVHIYDGASIVLQQPEQ